MISQNPTPPNTVFKYATAETARIILCSATLRFQSPTKFNDPLDSQWDLLRNARLPENIGEVHRRCAESHAQSGLGTFEEGLEAVRRNSTPDRVKRFLFHNLRRLRMCCFSKAAVLPTMWSHYGNEHRGVCLEFSGVGILQAARAAYKHACAAGDVEYTTPLPIQCTMDELQYHRGSVHPSEAAYLKYLSSKHADWQSEQEYRFAGWVPRGPGRGDSDDVPFEPTALVGLYRGVRTSERRWNELCSLALGLNPDVRYFECERDESTLGVKATER